MPKLDDLSLIYTQASSREEVMQGLWDYAAKTGGEDPFGLLSRLTEDITKQALLLGKVVTDLLGCAIKTNDEDLRWKAFRLLDGLTEGINKRAPLLEKVVFDLLSYVTKASDKNVRWEVLGLLGELKKGISEQAPLLKKVVTNLSDCARFIKTSDANAYQRLSVILGKLKEAINMNLNPLSQSTLRPLQAHSIFGSVSSGSPSTNDEKREPHP